MRLELVTCIVRGKNFPIILTATIYNSLGSCTLRLFFKAHAERMLQPRSADTKMFCSKTHMSRISGYVDNADHCFPTNVFHPFAKKTYVKVPKTNHN